MSSDRVNRPSGLRLVAIAGVGAAVVALAGCGSSGSPVAKKSGDALRHVTVLRSASSTFEPLYIAQQQGYFKAAGLSVTLRLGAMDSSQNAPAVLRGDAQFAMSDSGGFLKAAAGGLPVTLVSSLQVATTKDAQSDGLLVKAGSPISSYADLRGKTVGLPSLGGTLQYLCEHEAKAAGIAPNSIKFVALPVTSLLDAVTSGKVDAAYTFATFYDAGKRQGLRPVGHGTNDLPGLIQGLLFASEAYVSKNADTVKSFTGALDKAITYANAHPDAVRAVDLHYTQIPPAYIKTRSIQTFSPVVNTQVLALMATEMKQFGITKSDVDVKTVVWSGAQTTTSSR